jgi:hypothetical protein
MGSGPVTYSVSGYPDASPVVGTTYHLEEPEYRFGTGPILARVTHVVGPVDFGAGGQVSTWWEVEAVCKPPGTPYPGQPRQLYIRGDRLVIAVQRAARGRPMT